MILAAARRLLLAFAALCSASLAADPAVPADGIVGDWMVATGDAIIRFARNGDSYDGHIVWQLHDTYGPEDGPELNGKPVLDRRNPDPALRSHTVDGLRMIWGLRYDADEQEWSGGHVYDLEDGHTYRCRIRLVDADHLHLRGYFGISLLGGSTVWTRVRMLPAGSNPARTPLVPPVDPVRPGGGTSGGPSGGS